MYQKRHIQKNISGLGRFYQAPKSLENGKEDKWGEKGKLYEAQVVSVMLYNRNSWSATQDMLYGLDVAHRKHLKIILNIRWPNGYISKKALYKRCAELSERVDEMRWKMMGHVLRSDDNTPAMLSLKFALNSNNELKGRLGRPNTNLFSMIVDDLKYRNLQLTDLDDLNDVREIANCRKCRKLLY